MCISQRVVQIPSSTHNIILIVRVRVRVSIKTKYLLRIIRFNKNYFLYMFDNKPMDLPPISHGCIERVGAAFNHLSILLNSLITQIT